MSKSLFTQLTPFMRASVVLKAIESYKSKPYESVDACLKDALIIPNKEIGQDFGPRIWFPEICDEPNMHKGYTEQHQRWHLFLLNNLYEKVKKSETRWVTPLWEQ